MQNTRFKTSYKHIRERQPPFLKSIKKKTLETPYLQVVFSGIQRESLYLLTGDRLESVRKRAKDGARYAYARTADLKRKSLSLLLHELFLTGLKRCHVYKCDDSLTCHERIK